MPQNMIGVHGVSGAADSLVVVVGDGGRITHYYGDTYQAKKMESPTAANLYAVRVLSPRCAFAVGDHGAVLRWDGERWSTITMGAKDDELFAVWSCREEGVSPVDSIWIGGRDTLIVHYPATGAEGTLMHTDATLMGIWGSGPDNIWFLCAGRLALHWDGIACKAYDLPGEGDYDYSAIGGSGPEDPIWIAGRGGALLCGDESGWEMIDSGTDATLLGVCAGGPEDVWVTTHTGQLRHFDGIGWRVAAFSPFGWLGGVCMVDGTVWCAGAKGVVLQHRPQEGGE